MKRVVGFGLLVVAACSKSSSAPAPQPSASVSAAPSNDCGPLECRLYDSPREAVQAAIAGKPLVVAFGEAHALKGTEGIPSSAKRFTEDILPIFKGRASDLLLELMMPPGNCAKKAEAARTAQAPATEAHAAGDQGEYVAMGNAARPMGIIPDVLRPSCDDLAAIADAGDDAIERSLSTIERLSVAQTEKLLARADRDKDGAILLYGGALHNDPQPKPETADWSYGPALSKAVDGRYVAIDLFVPEYVADDATWRAWSWYPYYDRAKWPGKTVMFHPEPQLYVILFPVTKR